MNDYEIKQPPGHEHPVYEPGNGGIEPVLTTMPGWIVQWGTVVLCGLYAAFLVIAGFIHFPDIIKIPVHVTGPDPSGREGLVAEGRLPAMLADRISLNETVVISLAAYPPSAFGTLSGTIQRITPSAADSGTMLHIVINRGTGTGGHRELPRLPLGDGNATVVINDKTLLGRFFEKLIR